MAFTKNYFDRLEKEMDEPMDFESNIIYVRDLNNEVTKLDVEDDTEGDE